MEAGPHLSWSRRLSFSRTQSGRNVWMAILPTCLQERSEDLLGTRKKTRGYHETPVEDAQELLLEARAYLHLFHQESGMFEAYPRRFASVRGEIEQTGTYQQTYDEL